MTATLMSMEKNTMREVLTIQPNSLLHKTLNGTVATIANVVLDRADVTGVKVRDMLRPPPGA